MVARNSVQQYGFKSYTRELSEQQRFAARVDMWCSVRKCLMMAKGVVNGILGRAGYVPVGLYNIIDVGMCELIVL